MLEDDRIPRFAPRHRSDVEFSGVRLSASDGAVGSPLHASLHRIATPLQAALDALPEGAAARGHVQEGLRACRALMAEIARIEPSRPHRSPSIALESRAFRATGTKLRSRGTGTKAAIRVLLVEGSDEQRAYLAASLAPYADVTDVGSAEAALEMLRERPFEVVITDLLLPAMRGDELCIAIRADPQLQHLRLIVLTSVASRTVRDELLAEVVDDYLTTPIDTAELQFRLRRLGREARSARKLFEAARTDALTDLPNRRALIEALEQAAHASANGHRAAIALLDVDRFKRINDRHGHSVGDEVLVELANRLQLVVGLDNLVGRFGGEEFLLVLADAEAGAAISEVARRAVASASFSTSVGPLAVTVSVGVARFGDDDPTWTTVVERADARLYRAKSAGRDRVVITGALEADSTVGAAAPVGSGDAP